MRELLEQEVKPAQAGEEECRRYYAANQQRFCTPDLSDSA